MSEALTRTDQHELKNAETRLRAANRMLSTMSGLLEEAEKTIKEIRQENCRHKKTKTRYIPKGAWDSDGTPVVTCSNCGKEL